MTAVRLGLTGGMGCGKSAAGVYLAEHHGWLRVDSDDVVRALLGEAEVEAAITAEFGEGMLAEDGGLDRGRLASVVFYDREALARLEAILHPRVRARWQSLVAKAAVGQNCVVEIPLLFEKRLANQFDFTVCVAAGSSVRHSRLRKRGMSDDMIRARSAHQMSIDEKIEKADFVVWNDGSLQFLHTQIDRLVGELTNRCGRSA